MTTFHLGTSGWSYAEWVGPFYDKKEKMLSYYSSIFKTVEINSSFYRYPTKAQAFGYYRTVPKDFVFSAKLPDLLTHEKSLDHNLGVKDDLFRFLDLMDPINEAGKLGAILIQLPPSFTYEKNNDNLASFLEMLPEGYEFAVEFRHPSWLRNDIWKLLSNHNVAYTIVDEPLLPPEVHITANFAYVRWHGRGLHPWYNYHYSSGELKEWVPRMQTISDKVNKIYGYFNNHYHGYAPENCIEILGMLGLALPEQEKIKERIRQRNLQKRPFIQEKPLDEYVASSPKPSITELLLELTDQGRLDRGSEIRDEEIILDEITDKHIISTIRAYTVKMDLSEKIISHNCDDWKKGVGTKRLCKHLCKLFLTLQEEQSLQILEDLINEKDKWDFEYP